MNMDAFPEFERETLTELTNAQLANLFNAMLGYTEQRGPFKTTKAAAVEKVMIVYEKADHDRKMQGREMLGLYVKRNETPTPTTEDNMNVDPLAAAAEAAAPIPTTTDDTAAADLASLMGQAEVPTPEAAPAEPAKRGRGRPKAPKAEGEAKAPRVTKGKSWWLETVDAADATRFEGETSGSYIRRLLMSGVHNPNFILAKNIEVFGSDKTKITDVRFNFQALKNDEKPVKAWTELTALANPLAPPAAVATPTETQTATPAA